MIHLQAFLQEMAAKVASTAASAPAAAATGVAAGVGVAAATATKGSALADQLQAAIDAGGINIAIYMIGSKGGDKEFKRQADTWAGNHGAFGLSGGKVKKDHAMSLSSDPGKLVSDLLAAVTKELGTSDSIPIANVALFTHGGSTSMQVDSQADGSAEQWASAGNKVVKDFAKAVQPVIKGGKIHLFACNTGMDREAQKAKKDKKAKKPTYVPKGVDDPDRLDSFSENLQEMTGAEVWGHEDARHTTGNPQLVQVTDTNQDANAERYQVRDVLTRKFLLHVDAKLSEPQMGYLEEKLKISKWIEKSLQLMPKKQRDKLSKSERTKVIDNYQVFIEEISMMGYDKLFDLLIPDAPPGEAVFKSMFPEHDQIDKLVVGAASVHAKFHKDIDEKKKAIETARSSADFPN